MKATLSGVGFYKDIQQTPGIVESLVQYLASMKGTGGQGAGVQQESQAAPAVVMPNFNLNDEELQNVVIFLLSLQEHVVPWPKKSFAETAASSGQAASAGLMFAGKNGEELVKLAGCSACHKFDGPDRMVGPSLWDIGARKDKGYIRESILEPDKDVVSGYPPEVMKATLLGTGFYQNISLESLEKMVEYLASLKGTP
jgi:cytochrome c551/c552